MRHCDRHGVLLGRSLLGERVRDLEVIWASFDREPGGDDATPRPALIEAVTAGVFPEPVRGTGAEERLMERETTGADGVLYQRSGWAPWRSLLTA